jgi:hypothetical protein
MWSTPMIRTAAFLAASLVFITSAPAVDQPKEAPAAADANTPLALERKLHGDWKGPACGGVWTFAPDGTYAVQHYTPGNNKLTGSWQMRWNALPPTLVLTCKTTDAADRLPVGQTWELKLVQLEDEALAWQWPEDPSEFTSRYERVKR